MKFGVCVVLIGFLAQGSAYAEQTVVAVANNFYGPMKQLKQDFEAINQEHTIEISTGSTGQLYSQIENGAPFDLFFAADTVRPEKLVKEAKATGQFTYAKGTLVLWSEKVGQDLHSQLTQLDFKHLAMANPKLAPYGLAAEQSLVKMGVYNTVIRRNQVVLGKGLNPTYQFIATGNAELGFVAKSQVFKDNKYKTGSFWEVPADYYDEIRQDAVTLKTGETNTAAQAFLSYLKTERADNIIKRYGYSR